MRKRRHPIPPVDRFVDRAVWCVLVTHKVTDEWGFSRALEREYLVMVRRGVKGKGARWARTRLPMGDLRWRRREQIYADFVALVRQNPPVPANYVLALDSDGEDSIQWLSYEGECHA